MLIFGSQKSDAKKTDDKVKMTEIRLRTSFRKF